MADRVQADHADTGRGAFSARYVTLAIDDIDTDQIYPARYLKTLARDGMGEKLFRDWRYRRDGEIDEDFPLNQAEAGQAQILVAGKNFGCGSSREHAVWALVQYGFRAIVSSSFSDIFTKNSAKNDLLVVAVDKDFHAWLLGTAAGVLSIDVHGQTIATDAGATAEFPLDAFTKYCFLNNTDELGYMLRQEEAIRTFEAGRTSFLHTID